MNRQQMQRSFRHLLSVVRDLTSDLVGLGGLEPPTSRLSSARSNQLSYKPDSEDGGRTTTGRNDPFRPLSSVVRRPIRKRDEGGAVPPNAARQSRFFLNGPQDMPTSTDRSHLANLSSVLCPLSSDSRKEVIQPQVPLRLPCYDFTPVADPTVAGCLPFGLARRLRVKPTPMV
jgi:hypothetical protein